LQSGRLFTGAGAKFFYTGYEYSDDDVSITTVSPPDLRGTEWQHIFIQSYSSKRQLLPGTKFLYCEYDYNVDNDVYDVDSK
jgi:hypothetical protein